MGLFDIFKKKAEQKDSNECVRCFRPITGRVFGIDNKKYCQECYNKKMTNSLDFYFSTNSDKQTNDLKIIIYYDNHDSSTALCLHNTTHEVYMVCGKNVFLQDSQEGGRVKAQISSITLASLDDVAKIVNYKCDYTTFYNDKTSNILQTSHRKLVVDGNPYRIEWFLVVDNVEISQNQISLGESVFQVPARFLTEDQHKKYAEFCTRPGPYENCFDLPVQCCQKVVRKLVPIES